MQIGYYDQLGRDLDLTQRVREAIAGDKGEPSLADVNLMRRFWFDGDAQFAPIGTLSGGERRRLQLLLTLVPQPNVLLLDEPTNDLDLDTLRAMEDFLDDWPGIVVTVSHDRAFLDRVTDELLALDGNGGVRWIRGGVGCLAGAARRSRRRQPLPQMSAASAGPPARAPKPVVGSQPVDRAPRARPGRARRWPPRTRPATSSRQEMASTQRPLGAVDVGRAAGRRPGRRSPRPRRRGWPSPPKPSPSASPSGPSDATLVSRSGRISGVRGGLA